MTMKKSNDDITMRFTPNAPNQPDLEKLQTLRLAAIEFSVALRKLCPDNERRKRAEEQIEIGVMLAAKAITHN
jgi:hypothetical protein